MQAFRATTSSLIATATAPAAGSTSLPLDIAIETVVATLLMTVGFVVGAPPLRPIPWRVWAGKIEREGEDGFRDGSGNVSRDYLGNPFQGLETRPNFVDIRKQRREFAEWAKAGQEQ